jgi:hypothetical protein
MATEKTYLVVVICVMARRRFVTRLFRVLADGPGSAEVIACDHFDSEVRPRGDYDTVAFACHGSQLPDRLFPHVPLVRSALGEGSLTAIVPE